MTDKHGMLSLNLQIMICDVIFISQNWYVLNYTCINTVILNQQKEHSHNMLYNSHKMNYMYIDWTF